MAKIAHLMRRAGFGATREDLESYVAKGYEVMVEDLLHPENAPPYEDDDIIRRYHVDQSSLQNILSGHTYWVHRMINTKRPLEEKIALFWHGIFATGQSKLSESKVVLNQIDMFRRFGLGSFRTLLVQLSKNPAMIYWLDNTENHKDAVNENYGRELLELFSMGVGNYTEEDVRECSRAFTGWTLRDVSYHSIRASNSSTWPYGRLDWQFEYRAEDHDHGEKTFLGHTGPFNGEDIINIICQQPATARFVSRHLYNFFVADEPQVPSWGTIPPRDLAAIETLMNAFFKYEYDIRSVLRILFNSEFFKNAEFAKVKSPTELVVGVVGLTGGHRFPGEEDVELARKMEFMGQKLMNPPSVEGWHTGTEWLNTGSLVERVNFAVSEFADANKPGLRDMINRIRSHGTSLSPEELVDACLDLMGPITVSQNTRQDIVGHIETGGEIRFESGDEARSPAERIKEVLQLIVTSREYQLA